jgi:CHAT domain-containing protein
MDLKIGDIYKCPEGHNARIVWVSENGKVIAVKCPYKHFSKVEKVTIQTKSSWPYRNNSTEERKIFTKDMVFLIRI